MTYADEVLADSPLSYWRMEETSGTSIADEQAARNGSLTGGNLNVSGQVGSGLSLDGVDDHAAVGLVPSNMGAVTVEGIVKYESSTDDGGQILCCDSTTGAARGWQFRIDTTGGALTFIKILNGVVSLSGTTNLQDGEFHHLVGTYDGSELRVYVDGVSENSDAATGAITGDATALQIGRNPRASQEYLGGVVDEVAFYDYALSAARIQAHYDAAFATEDPANLAATVSGDTVSLSWDASPLVSA